MSQLSTDKYTHSTTTTTIPDWNELPCVQYGFPEDKGPIREPKLRTIFEPIPEGATTASPIYILTPEQYARQERLESGYEVSGEVTSIATVLQNECEVTNDVLYPVHIESDVYHKAGPTTLIEWFREFVEDYLKVPFKTCTLYFSGNRSIHVHVPRFIRGENDREGLKELAETFCDETGAELDCALYGKKRLFRLPGVEHSKTGLRKVGIESEWNETRIFREANESAPVVPESYEAVLCYVFATQATLTVESPQTTNDPPYDLFNILDSDETMLIFNTGGIEIETPLIERENPPPNASANEMKEWTQYNAKEFSPYANASGNKRSVAVLKVKGSAFARRDTTIGNSGTPIHALVPAYFYGAISCDGKFTKDRKHAPLQLSERDFKKWEYENGDYVVIIGGQSRSSRIFRVDSWQATVVGHALTGDGASRQTALDYLEDEGDDVGKAGNSGYCTPTSKSAGTRKPTESNTNERQESKAAKLQRQAEQEGIDSIGHYDVLDIGNRLLNIGGWSHAWEWFEKQYGKQFNPEETWRNLKGIVESYGDNNMEIPPRP